MVDLKALAATIKQLSPEEQQKLQTLVNHEVVPPRIEEDIETRIQALNQAFAEIRDSLTDQELDEMTQVMNSEYIEPEDEE